MGGVLVEHVVLETLLPVGPVVAEVAVEGLLPRVDDVVSLHLGPGGKDLAAHGASPHLLRVSPLAGSRASMVVSPIELLGLGRRWLL